MIFKLALKSLLERRSSVLLTTIALAISIAVVSSVEHIRSQAQESFNRTVSGVDLIVGPRTSAINLLLYSIFRIGTPGNGISSDTYQLIASDSRVAWQIPIALGDSHQGYRVVGTENSLFDHYQYGNGQSLAFAHGGHFNDSQDLVLGSDVASQLGYQLGDEIVLSHGLAEISFTNHDNHPFVVTGILAATGTPTDQALHIPLSGLAAMHGVVGHGHGDAHDDEHDTENESDAHDHAEDQDPEHEHENSQDATSTSSENMTLPVDITATLVGLNARAQVFSMQQAINNYTGEALTGVIPGIALAELWQMMANVEGLLRLISVLVMLASILGLATMLLASIRERYPEVSLFRSIGVPSHALLLSIEAEAMLIALSGTALGLLFTTAAALLSQSWLSQNYGLYISINPLSGNMLVFILILLLASALVSLIPAVKLYRVASAPKA
jgi:putative ABC transport system permease protein